MDENIKPIFGTGKWIILIILSLVVGFLISLLIPQPSIGVIYLNDPIDSSTANNMIAQINYAREHPGIKAVVLVVNSPGGTVTDTESVYLEFARLRETKPVITAVEGMAASGAYYLAVGSDFIMAKPSSEVGNVGIIGYLPSVPLLFEDEYSTGPYKLWGSPRDTFSREMEMLKQGFLQAVLIGRAGALRTDAQTILRGQIYSGSEALRLGLIDELGARSEAFEKAAQMAHIRHYKVENLLDLAQIPVQITSDFYYQSPEGEITPFPKRAGIYLLYIPPVEVTP